MGSTDNTVDASKEIFVKKFFPYAPITGGNVYDEFHKMISTELADYFAIRVTRGVYAPNEVDGVLQVVREMIDGDFS